MKHGFNTEKRPAFVLSFFSVLDQCFIRGLEFRIFSYSCLKASIGSSRAARQAGYNPNPVPTTIATPRDKKKEYSLSLVGKWLPKSPARNGSNKATPKPASTPNKEPKVV